eukprot:gnl/MRDRNA2_/MRDRNA2_87724_c0_seq1.p2 gnl/MRDRNA2_/MRDRNA2_87724_c0~~gnl/MRDRNA2_/MRDRNA2_87724_c0_seq1.p2  ORF type:complete len:135 (+),score=37.67 gnl/MRDRNA2_/MRDRNA2_87724_c0_seq1:78-482(+)
MGYRSIMHLMAILTLSSMTSAVDPSPAAVMKATNFIQSTKDKYHAGKFLALSQVHRFWPWGMQRQDGFTQGEHANKEAEDPSDYSVDQFINTDDYDDDNDDDVDATGKHKLSSKYQERDHDNFSEDEVADDDDN